MRPGDFISHVGPNRVVSPQKFYDAVKAIAGDVPLRLAVLGPAEVRTVTTEEE